MGGGEGWWVEGSGTHHNHLPQLSNREVVIGAQAIAQVDHIKRRRFEPFHTHLTLLPPPAVSQPLYTTVLYV